MSKTFHSLLSERLKNLKDKNSQYSIRAFAKKLSVSPATLSLVLNRKRKPSQSLISKVSSALKLDPTERTELLAHQEIRSTKIQQEHDFLLTNPIYFVVLNLLYLPEKNKNLKWFANKLNCSVERAEKVLDKLTKTGLIELTHDGYVKTNTTLRTSDEQPSPTLRQAHRDGILKSLSSLENDPISERDFTWLILPFNRNKQVQAKALIRKFQDDFLELMGKDLDPDSVYRLNIQFFPVSNNSININSEEAS